MAKAPTGLTITRNGATFTCKWKRGESYNKGEQFGSIVTGGKWTSVNLGSSVTSRAVTVSLGSYYPYTSKTLNSFSFRVRGKKGSKWSAFTSKAFALSVPGKPTLKVTPDDNISNRCLFAWETTTSTTGADVFIDCEYQSMLVANSNETDGSKLSWENTGSNDWRTGTKLSASGSVTLDETLSIATGSHTRWFRIRSRGPRGASAWVYGKRVYAAPYQMVIEEAKATKTNNGYQAYVKWSGKSNNAFPTDTLTVDYTMATPDPGMVCPSGASATTAITMAQNGATNAVSFPIDTTLGADQVLYARVNSIHNLSTTYGDWTFVSAGSLSAPSIASVSTNPSTFKATVTATNNSAVTDSFLAILYRTASRPDDFAVVGVIPHGSSSATVQCPDWTGETIQLGVYAVVGSYTSTTRADGVGSYEITANMESGIVWQSAAVPDAPTNVTATATNVEGSVKVVWNWSWADADNAIVSWADHEDAWESTDEPNEYTVSNVNAAEWTIAGLETGKRWYIRVRLANGTGDTAIYGPWSSMVTIDLSSAPSIPTLTLSSGIIPTDGSVSAYWTYVTTDGTSQAFAEITEAIIDGNGVHYGFYEPSTDTHVVSGKDYYVLSGGSYVPQTPVGTENPSALGWYDIEPQIIAQTETAQSVTIYAEEVGWNQNETHYLAVRVVSASGRVSDDWSDPVPVIIAAPLTANITQTSLVSTTTKENEQTFTGPIASFTSTVAPIVESFETDIDPIQDLNGYNAPWVGGAGKNKMPNNYGSGTINSLIVTKQSDGSYKINGTADADTLLYIGNSGGTAITTPFSSGNYILNGCPSGGSSSTYRIVAYLYSGSTYLNVARSDTGSGVSIDLSSGDGMRVAIDIKSGTQINNLVFSPMIRLSTESDATYEPYSNICPISGSTEVNTYVTGKNLLDLTNATLSRLTLVDASQGKVKANISSYYYGSITLSGANFPLPIKQATLNGTPITFQADNNNGKRISILIYGTRTNGTSYQEATNVASNSVTITPSLFTSVTSIELRILRDSTSYTDTTTEVSGLRLSVGSSGIDFEQYNGSTYTTTIGTTVYGGTLDVVSGELTVTHKLATFDGTEGWATEVISNVRSFYHKLSNSGKMSDRQSGQLNSELLSNMLYGYDYAVVGQIYVSSGGYLNCRVGSNFSATTDWATYLSSNNLQVWYPLATPQTYQLTPTQVATLIGDNNIWSSAGDIDITVCDSITTTNTLDQMPLTVTVTGAGVGGKTTLVIERAADYHVDRPDETDFNGYEGETIYVATQTGEDQMTVDREELLGSLDDGAEYRIVASVEDGLGQADTVTLNFDVAWAHQAVMPTGTAEMVGTVAKITPSQPVGYAVGDTVDIYRLSADRPELIVEGATMGTAYVDPYPAIGTYGGHRLVYKTYDGDYITSGNDIAWLDLRKVQNDYLDVDYSIIDFGDDEILLRLNLDVSNSWEKDFKETRYLGGSVQGDWNKGYSRSGNVNGLVVSTDDPDTIQQLKRLAVWDGICHLRTPEGSSFACDIQVSDDMSYSTAGKAYSVSLTITRVEPEELDGQEYSVWSYEGA